MLTTRTEDARQEAPLISPVSIPNLDLAFPGLNPEPKTRDPGPGPLNPEPGTGNREPGTIPVDVLWSCLRDLADELLQGRSVALRRSIDESARGDAYVFIADLIAGWVDRAERLLEEGMTRLWLRINGPRR